MARHKAEAKQLTKADLQCAATGGEPLAERPLRGIDVAKITCDQFTAYRITDPRNIAIWLSGYYNGKRDNMIIDTQVFNENYTKLRDFCIRNPQLTVIQAVERLFSPAR